MWKVVTWIQICTSLNHHKQMNAALAQLAASKAFNCMLIYQMLWEWQTKTAHGYLSKHSFEQKPSTSYSSIDLGFHTNASHKYELVCNNLNVMLIRSCYKDFLKKLVCKNQEIFWKLAHKGFVQKSKWPYNTKVIINLSKLFYHTFTALTYLLTTLYELETKDVVSKGGTRGSGFHSVINSSFSFSVKGWYSFGL